MLNSMLVPTTGDATRFTGTSLFQTPSSGSSHTQQTRTFRPRPLPPEMLAAFNKMDQERAAQTEKIELGKKRKAEEDFSATFSKLMKTVVDNESYILSEVLLTKEEGKGQLLAAIESGNLEMVQDLINNHYVSPAFGLNAPLIAAWESGHDEIANYLLTFEKVQLISKHSSLLTRVCRLGQFRSIEKLIRLGNKPTEKTMSLIFNHVIREQVKNLFLNSEHISECFKSKLR